jgi:hypothetical protein
LLTDFEKISRSSLEAFSFSSVFLKKPGFGYILKTIQINRVNLYELVWNGIVSQEFIKELAGIDPLVI